MRGLCRFGLGLAMPWLWAGAMAATPAPGTAGPSLTHKDWALQCDNTRACAAVGYQADDGQSDPVAMRVARPGGPHSPVHIELMAFADPAPTAPLQLQVGKLVLAGLANGNEPAKASRQLSDAEVQTLLPELLKNASAQVRSGRQRWTLSLAGVNAVLLKMDEVQGRLDTPSAIVRKGNQALSSVPPALSAPQLKSAKPVPTRKGDAALVKPLLAAVGIKSPGSSCDGSEPLGDPEVFRLTEHTVLLSVACSSGAYNASNRLWLARDVPPYAPQALEADGEFDPRTGEIIASMKGRGLGDCWSQTTWQFDGKDFVLAEQTADQMCRGFPGGAWQLPSYVTRRDSLKPTPSN